MAQDEFDIEAFLLQEALEAEEQAQLAQLNSLGDVPDFFKVVWPEKAVVASWLKQALLFSSKKDEAIGLLQGDNGPCGVLAVILGDLVSNRLLKTGVCQTTQPFSDQEICTALLSIFVRVCPKDEAQNMISTIKIATWKEPEVQDTFTSHDAISTSEFSTVGEAQEFLFSNLRQFKAEGFLALLLYSIVLTHGPELVKSEMVLGGGTAKSTLVEKITPSTWFCSSELMSLLLRGTANGNLGAYNELGQKVTAQLPCPIGLLSYREAESRIPITDAFKNPTCAVWLLHSGDHFTVVFSNAINPKLKENLNDPKSYPLDFALYHWNGLKPNGPKLTTLVVKAKMVSGTAPEKIVQNDYVPLPGEIEDLIQVDKALKEKFKFDFTRWKYEVLLAIKDTSVSGPKRPKNLPSFIFSLGNKPVAGERWRCASCYRKRHQTMCFGENPESSSVGSDVCKFCEQSKESALWTIWLDYDQLPPDWKRRAAFYYGPKILSILRTKWPGCEIVEPPLDQLFRL